MNTNTLRAALLTRYPAESWALAWEVGDGTGRHCTRHADAVAMGLWPSRGLELHGLELKASRTDWLKELKDPAKADSVAKYCDRWWLVVANKDMVRPGELPPLWGLLAMTGDTLKQIVEAKPLKPIPIDRVFLAGLMRACAKPAARDNKDALQKEYWKGQEASRQYSEPKIKRLEDELAKVRAEIHQFEQAAGFRLNQGWKGTAHAGQVVRDVLAGKHDRDHDDIRHIRELAQGIVERADAELAKESEVAQ